MKYAFPVPLEERVTLFGKRLFGFHTVQGFRRQVEKKLRKIYIFWASLFWWRVLGIPVTEKTVTNLLQRKLFRCTTHILESWDAIMLSLLHTKPSFLKDMDTSDSLLDLLSKTALEVLVNYKVPAWVVLWAKISDWEAQSQAAIRVCFTAVKWGYVGIRFVYGAKGLGGSASLWEQCGIWHPSSRKYFLLSLPFSSRILNSPWLLKRAEATATPILYFKTW